jgi:site-specific DNA-methyltransferase (adenine-specific)
MKWSGNDNYATPDYLYCALDKEFGFNFDPCPLNDAPMIDGLSLPWDGKRAFINPPWSNIGPWVTKALQRDAELVVLLVPARTDTGWFHALKDNGAELRFFRKRVVFNDHNGKPKERPTDGALVAVIRKTQ